MAIKGSATITLTQYRDTQSVTRYYILTTAGSSAPSKPTTNPPSSDWSDSEPACDISKTLYFCDLTIFSNGEWDYSEVSKSSSYEAAKEAYNLAQNASDASKYAQKTADETQTYVLGVQTFEYILDGVAIPVNKRDDGTYYYILNDEEIDVAEADLVYDESGDLKSYSIGGVYEDIEFITGNIESLDTKVNSFDAREQAIYKSIQDNSLISKGKAIVDGSSLILTNDEALLNYLKLNSSSIVIYGNGKDIVTISKTSDDSGYMKMNGTSMLQAQESRFCTMRMRSSEGTGNLAFVAGSDGHLSIREVL